ncbi:MAG TPA: serine/threonine-protein kinase [Polyangiaceae bacterium]
MVVRDDQRAALSRVGEWLAPDLRIVELLAVGGNAGVYAAERGAGKTVAVKVLHARLCEDTAVRERFVREAYLVNCIDHPGVVPVAEHGATPDGVPFLLMELLHGETAAHKRTRLRGRLPELEVLSIAERALSVLHQAHAAGILHRDISPSNLFLCSDGSLRVLDFGNAGSRESAHVHTSVTRTGEVIGTAAYMSPELALGAHRCVDIRSDIYSLGATLFRLLSSEWVFPSVRADAQRLAVIASPARSLARALPGAHPCTIRLVDRALSYERSERWQTAGEMQEACREAMTAILERGPATAKPAERDLSEFEEFATQRALPPPDLV